MYTIKNIKMELITLATTALAFAAPYLSKTGEKIAESIGEEVWNILRKPFTNESDTKLLANLDSTENQKLLSQELLNKLSQDSEFEKELRFIVDKAQKQLTTNSQQNIHNNGNIEKQINIQNNSGAIQM